MKLNTTISIYILIYLIGIRAFKNVVNLFLKVSLTDYVINAKKNAIISLYELNVYFFLSLTVFGLQCLPSAGSASTSRVLTPLFRFWAHESICHAVWLLLI